MYVERICELIEIVIEEVCYNVKYKVKKWWIWSCYILKFVRDVFELYNVKYLWKYNCYYGDEKKFIERRNDGYFCVNCVFWYIRIWVWVKFMVFIDRICYFFCYIIFLWVIIICIVRINNWNFFFFYSRILFLVIVFVFYGFKFDDWWFWNFIVILFWSVDNVIWIDVFRIFIFGIVFLNLDFFKFGRLDNGE